MSSFFAKLHRPGAAPVKKQELVIKKIKVPASSSNGLGRSPTPSSRQGSLTPLRGNTPNGNDKAVPAKRKLTSNPESKSSVSPPSKSTPSKPPAAKKKKLIARSAPIVERPFAGTDVSDDSEGDDSLSGRERSVSVAVDPKRRLLDLKALRCEKKVEFMHAAQISSVKVEGYRRAFPMTKSERQETELVYPALEVQEKYAITVHRNPDEFAPVDEMVRTIELVARDYLPPAESQEILDESTGYLSNLKRAWKKSEPKAFYQAIDTINALMKRLKAEGKIEEHIRDTTRLDFELIEHILSQTYARTVALDVESLRKYEAFSNNVYGELLPKFTTRLFKEANLRSDDVFVDLGSGTGNVVLHAALEIGCESWGCEVMEAACKLADKQAKEFVARTKLYGLRAGKVVLEKGDFCENQRVVEVLRRADMLLVNNYAFSSELNGRLLDMFLDLKEGCTIVSLKSFVPPNHVITERNASSPINLLTVQEKEYFSGCVSWTNAPGRYYVHKVDRTALRKFFEARGM